MYNEYMEFIRRELPKVLIVVLLIGIVIFFSRSQEKPANNNPQADLALNLKHENNYDQFYVDKLAIVMREGGKVVFSLSADKIFKRKRISKFFVYQNLKEICISGVKIDIYSYNKKSLTNNNVLIPVDEIGRSVTSMGKPSTPVEDYLAGNADIDLDLLSRLLFEKLTLAIHTSPKKKMLIEAESAKINIDMENIVFEGDIKVIDSDGVVINTEEVVWSRKHAGIYIPGKYNVGSMFSTGKSFFGINRNGEVLKMLAVPVIEYVDPLEEREKVFYANISKKMPGYARFMFGMP
ncbi:MAG: hypothetical protein OEW04_02230 [Nitrospirota bacterium]|nr:hypothetical protein [Nitrospirota bacterium]